MQWRNVARLPNRSCNRHTITLFPTISKRKNCVRLPLTGQPPARVCCCRPKSGVDFEPMACVHRGNQLYGERAVSKVISNPTNPYKLKCTNPMRTSSRINRRDFTRGVFAAGIGIGLSRGADMGTGTVFSVLCPYGDRHGVWALSRYGARHRVRYFLRTRRARPASCKVS